MLGESDIIHFLKARFPEAIGDDAAVLPLSKSKSWIVTKDILVEDVHFRLNYQDASALAHKALHVNLSDVAGMGAVPNYVLLGLSIPEHSEKYLREFLKSFSKACKACGVILVGGDTTRSPDKLFVSATVIGTVSNSHVKLRSLANIGDVICVAGHLGDAHIGFTALERSLQPKARKTKEFDRFKKAFLKPNALLKEGCWFGKQNSVTAMMDISDGLFIDLEKLSHASKMAAEINIDNLQSTKEFKSACEKLKLDPLETQLIGGEDYGLLLTINFKDYPHIASKFSLQFGYDLKMIGKIIQGNGVRFIQNGHPKKLKLKPFSHFTLSRHHH